MNDNSNLQNLAVIVWDKADYATALVTEAVNGNALATEALIATLTELRNLGREVSFVAASTEAEIANDSLAKATIRHLDKLATAILDN